MTVKHNLSNNMSEQDLEQLDAINPDEEQELDQDSDDTEDVETLKARLAEREAEIERERKARRQMFARFKKQDGKPHIKKDIDTDVMKDVSELKLAERKRQFGYQHGLSPEETDKLFRFTGEGDPEETLKDSFFQTALTESRRQKNIDEATPSITNRSKKVEGKTFAEMDRDQRKNNWKKITGVN